MYDGSKLVRLIDFGLTKHATDPERDISETERESLLPFSDTQITPPHVHSGGTPSYASPETDFRQFSEKSDIYSLGVVFGELLIGYCPVSAEQFDRVASYERSNIPQNLRELVKSMLAQDPLDRPSAIQVYTEIKSWIRSAKPELLKKMPFDYHFGETQKNSEEEVPLLKAA